MMACGCSQASLGLSYRGRAALAYGRCLPVPCSSKSKSPPALVLVGRYLHVMHLLVGPPPPSYCCAALRNTFCRHPKHIILQPSPFPLH